jgi:Holliday junction resolvase RusA-like endonuclease
MTRVTFAVYGTPIAQGSKRLVGRHMIESSKHLRPWRALVTDAASEAMQVLIEDAPAMRPLTGPLTLNATFRFARPMKHYVGNNRENDLRPEAPLFHTSAPDLDKLLRSICDGMADAGVMLNDSHVAAVHARKVYANSELPGAYITIEMLDSYLE